MFWGGTKHLAKKSSVVVMVLIATFLIVGCGKSGSGEHRQGTTIDWSLEKIGTVTLAPEQRSAPYLVTVPDEAVSFTIIADGGKGTTDLDITTLTAPDGTPLLIGASNDDPIGRNYAEGPGQSTVSFTYPHTAKQTLVSGEYQFTITHFEPVDNRSRSIDLYKIIKPRTGSIVDVNIFIVAIDDYTGPEMEQFVNLLTAFKKSMKHLGVTVGEVSVYELDDEVAQRLTILDPSKDVDRNSQPDDMDELLQLSSMGENGRLNFFLITTFYRTAIIGISGGIPGPQLLNGTPHSGVVVSLFGGFTYLDKWHSTVQADTMAHEAGHYIGLFHTTESNGRVFDPVSDTPECNNTYDYNNDGYLTPTECKKLDGPNLMFWAAAEYAQEVTSAEQKKVIKLAPVVR